LVQVVLLLRGGLYSRRVSRRAGDDVDGQGHLLQPHVPRAPQIVVIGLAAAAAGSAADAAVEPETKEGSNVSQSEESRKGKFAFSSRFAKMHG
jgi:hypothetical protein